MAVPARKRPGKHFHGPATHSTGKTRIVAIAATVILQRGKEGRRGLSNLNTAGRSIEGMMRPTSQSWG
jgi:hypothetical protein